MYDETGGVKGWSWGVGMFVSSLLALTFMGWGWECRQEAVHYAAMTEKAEAVASGYREAMAIAEGRARQAYTFKATWYGYDHKRITASGLPFDGKAFTCAHRTLALGTTLLLSHEGRYCVVTVTDRGPEEWTGKTLDVSRAVAQALGFERDGVATLDAEVLSCQ